MQTHKSTLLVRLLIIGAFLVVTILLARPVTAEPAEPAAPDNRLIAFDGLFNLTQYDGSNCGFSGAPFTSGDVELFFDWANHVGTVEMNGDGQGWRRGLRCGDSKGDMYWTADYQIFATGEVNQFTGEFIWFGFLEGTGSTVWANCENEDGPTSCPGFQEFEYRFDVVKVDGRVSCEGETAGKIQVLDPDINLVTVGQWFATQVIPERLSLSIYRGVIDLNGLSLPLNCHVPLIIGDRLESKKGPFTFRVNNNCLDSFKGTLDEVIQSSGNGEDPYLLIVSGTRLGEFSMACIEPNSADAFAVDEPALSLDLQKGSGSFIVPEKALPAAVESSTAVTNFGASSHLVIRTDKDWSEVASMRGQATIVPKNSALDPVLLNDAQQVSVSEGEVGPVIDLSLVNIPFVSVKE